MPKGVPKNKKPGKRKSRVIEYDKPYKWKDEYYVRIYQMVKEGLKPSHVAKILGVDEDTLAKWVKDDPALKEAIRAARSGGKKGEDNYLTFREYVYGHLPERARAWWDRIDALDKTPMSKSEKERERAKFVEGQRRLSIDLRKHLYLYALVNSNFMHHTACEKLGMAPQNVRDWMLTDDYFKEVVRSMHEYKKDFFEGCLVDLVRRGDASATIFVNKTLNADRGYGTRVQVDVGGKVEHEHFVSPDDLSPEVLQALLEATRKKRMLLENKGDVIEAEIIE